MAIVQKLKVMYLDVLIDDIIVFIGDSTTAYLPPASQGTS